MTIHSVCKAVEKHSHIAGGNAEGYHLSEREFSDIYNNKSTHVHAFEPSYST